MTSVPRGSSSPWNEWSWQWGAGSSLLPLSDMTTCFSFSILKLHPHTSLKPQLASLSLTVARLPRCPALGTTSPVCPPQPSQEDQEAEYGGLSPEGRPRSPVIPPGSRGPSELDSWPWHSGLDPLGGGLGPALDADTSAPGSSSAAYTFPDQDVGGNGQAPAGCGHCMWSSGAQCSLQLRNGCCQEAASGGGRSPCCAPPTDTEETGWRRQNHEREIERERRKMKVWMGLAWSRNMVILRLIDFKGCQAGPWVDFNSQPSIVRIPTAHLAPSCPLGRADQQFLRVTKTKPNIRSVSYTFPRTLTYLLRLHCYMQSLSHLGCSFFSVLCYLKSIRTWRWK